MKIMDIMGERTGPDRFGLCSVRPYCSQGATMASARAEVSMAIS